MTAQATTAEQAGAKPVEQEPKGNPAVPATATPQPANPSGAQQPEQAKDVDAEIAAAEKRAQDKREYLEKLNKELSGYDSEIGKHQAKISAFRKQQAQQQPASQAPQQPAQQDVQAMATAAQNLGLTGEQFLNLLREDPDKALAAYGDALERRMEQKIQSMLPVQLERHRVETDVRSKLARIHEELGDEQFGDFMTAVQMHQQQGFTPTPDHILNDLKFGSPDYQRKLMEFALATLQQQAGHAPAPAHAPAAPGQRPAFPMAPGGGSPVQPQQRGQGQPNNMLRSMGWNT